MANFKDELQDTENIFTNIFSVFNNIKNRFFATKNTKKSKEELITELETHVKDVSYTIERLKQKK